MASINAFIEKLAVIQKGDYDLMQIETNFML